MTIQLTKEGKEELALAIVLWKDFKCDGKLDAKVMKDALMFCRMLGITDEFNEMLIKTPPMRVIERR